MESRYRPVMADPTSPTAAGPTGVHHVAYVCRDLEATHHFYEDLMGFQLVHTEVETLENGGFFRHTFYDLGDGTCIAFFDVHGVGEKDGWSTAISKGVGLPVWVNHVAFKADEARQQDVRDPHGRRGDRAADGGRPRLVPFALLRGSERDHGRVLPRHARASSPTPTGPQAVHRHRPPGRREDDHRRHRRRSVTDPVERDFVGLPSPVIGRAGAGGHPCQGVYHTPAHARPTTAFIATHYNVDFSEHYLAEYLAARGYGFLGWNTRFRGAEAYFLLDHALAEIAVGVQWLRDQGVERVVLLGNSGGGSLMAAYHSQGAEPNIRRLAAAPSSPRRWSLPAADLFVFVAAHPGRPEVLTDWMDAVRRRRGRRHVGRPGTRPVRPGNGPPFDAEFVARYRDGQRGRNARITAWCHAELDRLSSTGQRPAVHDDPDVGRPAHDRRRVDPSDRRTPWCYLGDPKRANSACSASARVAHAGSG